MEEYDQRSLFPTHLICYHILHTMVEFELVAYMQTHEKNSVNMFKMSIGTSEPTKGGGEQGVAYVAYV